MHRKKLTLIIIAIFYVLMLVFTLSARTIHNATLPRVEVIILEYEQYATQDADGEGSRQENRIDEIQTNLEVNLGIPKEILNKGKVYTISRELINGEERNIAREVTDLAIGRSNATSYEIISGLSAVDSVIISGQNRIQDGSEVYVED